MLTPKSTMFTLRETKVDFALFTPEHKRSQMHQRDDLEGDLISSRCRFQPHTMLVPLPQHVYRMWNSWGQLDDRQEGK